MVSSQDLKNQVERRLPRHVVEKDEPMYLLKSNKYAPKKKKAK